MQLYPLFKLKLQPDSEQYYDSLKEILHIVQVRLLEYFTNGLLCFGQQNYTIFFILENS